MFLELGWRKYHQLLCVGGLEQGAGSRKVGNGVGIEEGLNQEGVGLEEVLGGSGDRHLAGCGVGRLDMQEEEAEMGT